MIECPGCKKKISDKSDKCIFCGHNLKDPHVLHCKKCKAVLEPYTLICPKCGCPVDYEEFEKYEDYENGDAPKEGGHLVRSIMLVLLIALLGVGVYYIYQYERHYEYYTTLEKVFDAKNKSDDEIQDCYHILISVWDNVISQRSDPETDKYTCVDGVFYDNPKEAVDKLYESKKFRTNLELIKKRVVRMEKLRDNLKDPPSDVARLNEAVLDLIDNHAALYHLLANPSDSFIQVNSTFNDLFRERYEIQTRLQDLTDKM